MRLHFSAKAAFYLVVMGSAGLSAEELTPASN